MNKKPKRTKSEKILTAWKVLRGFMIGSKYVVAELPATIMVIVKHSEWFPTVTQTVSVSMGFSMFCITILISLFCIAKKSETYDKLSPFITASIYMVIAGAIMLFMANIINDLGWLCVYTGVGMIVAVAEDTVERRVVRKKVEEWEAVLTQAGINSSQINKENRMRQNVERAKREAQEMRDML